MTNNDKQSLDTLNGIAVLAFREPSILGGKYSDAAAPRFEMIDEHYLDGASAHVREEFEKGGFGHGRHIVLPLSKSERERGSQLLDLMLQSGIEGHFVTASSDNELSNDQQRGIVVALDQPEMDKKLPMFLEQARALRAEAAHVGFADQLEQTLGKVPAEAHDQFLLMARGTLDGKTQMAATTHEEAAQRVGREIEASLAGLSPDDRQIFLLEVKRMAEAARHRESDSEEVRRSGFADRVSDRREQASGARQPG